MPGIGDLLATIAAALVALLALLAVQARLTRDRGLRGELVAYFGAATLAALACAVMNIIELTEGGAVAAAIGNATNVLAPATLWAGARRINGRSPGGLLPAVAVSLLVFAITFVLTADAATLLKTAAVGAFAALGAREVRRLRLRPLPGSRIIGVSLALFAAFCISRLVIAAVGGMDSWAWRTFASPEVTSFASAVAILGVSVGTVRLGRRLLDAPEPGSRAHARQRFRADADALLSAHPDVVGLRVHIRDLPLIRAAHGPAHAEAVLAAAERAAREALPEAATGVLTRDTIGVLVPADGADDDTADAVRRRFSALADGTGLDAADLRITRGALDAAQVEAFFDTGG